MVEDREKGQLTPREIVDALNRHIVGQSDAKRAVAVALRNRIRRRRLPESMQEEILPKNILMIGPTGVGKTEIARRLARLVSAPFIKVEATKFTEVGYVGRDVESMVRDLLDTAIRMEKNSSMKEVEEKAERLAEHRIIDELAPLPNQNQSQNPFAAFFGGQGQGQAGPFGQGGPQSGSQQNPRDEEDMDDIHLRRQQLREQLRRGELEDQEIEIEVEENQNPMIDVFSGAGMEEMSINIQDMLGGMLPNRKKKRRVTVAEARRLLKQEEAQKLIDMDRVVSDAVQLTEQSGIIFLDEIDKIAGEDAARGAEVSREGVQRDILPIVEGSTVMTKHGPIKTDHILFIAAGAFHMAKPSDLIPELQGRFPIRVELSSLTREDFKRILVEPENSLVKQYESLLETDGLEVTFSEDGINQIARIAQEVNENTENIGARRLHTIMEQVVEDLSFRAPEMAGESVTIDAGYVEEHLAGLVEDQDLSRYIL